MFRFCSGINSSVPLTVVPLFTSPPKLDSALVSSVLQPPNRRHLHIRARIPRPLSHCCLRFLQHLLVVVRRSPENRESPLPRSRKEGDSEQCSLIVNLNYMLSKAMVKAKPTTLWCYKDKLDISSHRKKRARDIKRKMRTGVLDPDKADSFSLFVEGGGISYCLYKDSERILGNTFSMCILQVPILCVYVKDFEALTPNLLARTIETVEESHSEAVGRFNERFLLSLASCKACVVMDDEFNILPISSHIRSIKPVPVKEGKAVITFLDAILDKTLRSTIALLAARGRGKSAALGLAVAGAVAAGLRGSKSSDDWKLPYLLEHIDYDVVKSSNSEVIMGKHSSSRGSKQTPTSRQKIVHPFPFVLHLKDRERKESSFR
ncbi:hypothetical protein V2J09_004293 [Rumex salicifolius]